MDKSKKLNEIKVGISYYYSNTWFVICSHVDTLNTVRTGDGLNQTSD